MGITPIGPEEPLSRRSMNERFETLETEMIPQSEKGRPGGVVPLGSDGRATAQYMPESIGAEISARCMMKAGVYTGDGKSSQFIDVGFTVAAVLIENQQGSRNSSSNSGTSGGLAVKGGSIYHGTTLASVSGTGFTVYNGGEYQGAFNREGGSYYYIAWGTASIQ